MNMSEENDFIIGIIKPKRMSSHDVINIVRRKSGIKRVGHAGTLDPLASGVLVVAIGRENTKKLTGLLKKDKEYVATINLGMDSTTDDEEGEKTEYKVKQIPSKDQIENVIKNFIGEIKQTPPLYSAVKVNGKPAYYYARKGKELRLEERTVFVYGIEILNYEYPVLLIKVSCGSGVYIRSLARSIGEKLGTGAYLADLMRTRVGDFYIEKAYEIDDLDELFKQRI
jgi:tRNA pseudouridine55 synthase